MPSSALARELALLRYAFSFRRAPERDASSFTLYERSGYGGILVALLLATGVEMVVVHLILAPHHVIAGVFAGLGVYSALWFLGDYQAIRLRPSFVEGDEILLRLGLRKQLRVRRDQVRSLEALSGDEPAPASGYARFTAVGAPETLVRFDPPARLERMYLPAREVTCLGVTLDDEAGFRAVLAG